MPQCSLDQTLLLLLENLVKQWKSQLEANWIAAKRVLRYLKGTATLGPTYSETGNHELIGYSDSDWGEDTTTRKSTTGYVFTLGGAAISWSSKRQPTVALSSMEAEYMAACGTTQEAIFIKGLLRDLHHEQRSATIIFQDNQGAIRLENDAMTNKRSKHIDIKYHYIRDKIKDGEIATQYINTTNMIADCLTKPVETNPEPYTQGNNG